MSFPPRPLAERFWEKVDRTGTCWLWTAHCNNRGYGWFYDQRKNRPAFAHRIAWELENGPVPPGLHVLHHCDTPPCVRPLHLFTGTLADNSADMKAKGRSPRTIGDRNGKSKITEAEADEIRRLWAAGGITQIALGAEYGIHSSHVSRIVNQKRRVYVNAPNP